MKIAKNLNLIIPVRTEKGNGWIHATPSAKKCLKSISSFWGKPFQRCFPMGLVSLPGRVLLF